MNVWRLGYWENPCDFIPRRLCRWHHRFDDPLKEYRTLYCAKESITCLRELLADLRPNKKALMEFEEIFSSSAEEDLNVAGIVSAEWRRQHVLVKAEVLLDQGILVDIEQRFKHVDISQIRSRERIVTQRMSRTLFEERQAGISFRSRLDGQPCFALFEGRAALRPIEAPISMATDHPDLIHVCGEYTLVLRPVTP